MSKDKCCKDECCKCRKEYKKHHKDPECEIEPKCGCLSNLFNCCGNESFIIFLILILLIVTCGADII
jgi:hypothetical protein